MEKLSIEEMVEESLDQNLHSQLAGMKTWPWRGYLPPDIGKDLAELVLHYHPPRSHPLEKPRNI